MTADKETKQAVRSTGVPDGTAGIDFATVRKQLEELKATQRSLEMLLEKFEVNSAAQGQPAEQSPENRTAAVMPGETKARPLRAVILDALHDLDSPAYTRELSLYCQARYGRTIAATRFGTLAADEEKAFQRANQRPRPVWLGFGLTYDRHQAIKRLLVRSDMPLEKRIVAPTTGRIQHLWMTHRLCDLALEAGQTTADPEMLKIIAADHARDVLGVKVRRGEFDLEGWREAAEAQLIVLLPEDELLRQESAERLAARPPRIQLFGMPEVIEGGRVDVGRKRDRA